MTNDRFVRGLSAALLLSMAGAAHGQLVIGLDEDAEPVRVYDFNTSMWRNLFTPADYFAGGVPTGAVSSDGPSALACDDIGRMIYWNDAANFYSASYDSDNGAGQLAMQYVADTLNGATSVSLDGLAFANGVLYGVDSSTAAADDVYSVDPATGALTPVLTDFDSGSLIDPQGFDYNPLDGLFYISSDDTSPGPAGLYSLNISTGALTFVVAYAAGPGELGDCDGLAVGVQNGQAKAFFIHDNNDGEYAVYNITLGAFETPLPVAPGIVGDEVFSGGAWGPGLVEPPVDDDLRITIDESADPVTTGAQLTYNLRVRNAGATTLTNVNVATSLAGLTSFVSSTDGFHDGSLSGGVHTATFASIAPLSSELYQIVVTAAANGTATATATGTLDQIDPDPANNTASAETSIGTVSDLVVTIADAPDPIHTPNELITYTIQLRNDGPADANNVVLTVDLPPESTFDLANAGTHDGSALGGTVTVNYPTVFAGFTEAVSVRVITGANGDYVATASAASDSLDPSPENATASTTTDVNYSADLAVDLKISTGVAVGAGDPVHFFLDITNSGPGAATDVPWSVTLPDGVAFLASNDGTHDGSLTGGVVSGIVPSLAVDGLYETTIFTQTVGLGEAGAGVASAPGGTPVDDNQANNTSTTRTLVVIEDTDDYGRLLLSDDLADGNFGPFLGAFPPGQVRKFETFDKPFISPDGTKYILAADMVDDITSDEVVVVFDGTTLHTVVQEGADTLGDFFDFVGAIDQKLGINDNVEYVFATNTFDPSIVSPNPQPTNDEVIVKGGIGFNTVVAREENTFPNGGIFTYGTILESPSITNTGAVYFMADTDDPTTTVDDYFVVTTDNGATVTTLLQEGVSTPGNQVNGGFELWGEFDANDVWVTGDGMHHLIIGDLDGPTLNDDVAVYDNNVVIQENVLVHPSLGDSADDVTAVDAIYLAQNGDWYARGSNNNNTHWVLKNGEVIARSGDPIFPGSTENWAASNPTGIANPTFFFVVGDHRGNYVVGGFIDSGDERADVVLVLNGERVVSREYDPIDMDGNGFFDDSPFNNGGPVFINSYGDDDGIITEDGQLIVVANTRLVSTNVGFHNGDVVLTIPLGLDAGATCACETDGNAAQVNVFDLLAYLDLWFVNAAGADIDGTPGVNVFDLLFFLDCWFPASAGAPCP